MRHLQKHLPQRMVQAFTQHHQHPLGDDVQARMFPSEMFQMHQRLQKVQQSQSNPLGIPSLSGGNEKQFSSQKQNPLLQKSSAISPHGSLGIQAPGFNVMSSASLQQQSNAMTQQLGQQPYVADVDHVGNDDQLQQNLPDDSTSITASKAISSEGDSKGLFDTSQKS
ncbi:uncharacterized protein LOC108840765 isoform X2 [Raphanus sativus]|uniref:Uncharacterized protein LOC108840765 isoform X2 n=1 Tax=Raphanus sativus TaxID=3726 RepID=A0A9W3C7W7_RAPSA|nr:uncharacterized protein LOC108840765 isoform X2 [Raphanus sativus]